MTFDLTTVSADGTPVNLSEPAKDGYTLGDVTCTADGEDNQTGSSGAVNVTVKPGETWTCTFDNTTNTGTLRVRKFVDGSQAAGWTITGSSPSSPMTFTPGSQVTDASGFEVFALSQVVAGPTGSDLTLTETQQSGFVTGTATCTGPRSDQRGPTNAGAVTVNVRPGETWDCTFNNSTVQVAPAVVTDPPATQVSPAQVEAPQVAAALAFTGSDSTAPLGLLGAILVAIGAFTVVLSRRRRKEPQPTSSVARPEEMDRPRAPARGRSASVTVQR